MGDDTLTRAEDQALARARHRVAGQRRDPARRRTPSRSRALDTARGLAIALAATAIVAGDAAAAISLLRPTTGPGFGPVDLLPIVLTVLVGVSMAHQVATHTNATAGWWTARLVRRVVVLVGVGLLLSWLQVGDPGAVRVTGPLTRLAVGGVLAWLVATRLPVRAQAAVAVALTAAQGLLLGRGVLGAGSVASRLEAGLLGTHAGGPLDADGLIGLGPTVAAVLAGVWIGNWLRQRPAGPATVAAFALAGAYATIGALAWAQVQPVHTARWTGPTVLLGAGVVLVLLALSHLATEVAPTARALRWVTALGAEALPAYAVATAVAVARAHPGVGTAWDALHAAVARPLLGPELGTLALAVLAVALLARGATALCDRRVLLRA